MTFTAINGYLGLKKKPLKMQHKTDIAIIGAGPVGLFAVFEAGMLNMHCHVIDALDMIGGQCKALYPEKPIYDIPAYPKISAAELIDRLIEQTAPFKPTYHLNQQVLDVTSNPDGTFSLITSTNTEIIAKSVIIAAGCGAFGPNRPPLDSIEQFENKSVFYFIDRKERFKGKNVVIAGGGDSAVDWAIELASIANVTLMHRRGKFKCMPESLNKLEKLQSEGLIKIETPYQLHALRGSNGILTAVDVIDLDGNKKSIVADVLLPFFGLAMDVGPILNWDLKFNQKHIIVEPATMETNIPGMYAIGDIATYAGKLKLILTGFSEAAIAAHAIYNRINPNTPLHFEYSTTKGIKVDA